MHAEASPAEVSTSGQVRLQTHKAACMRVLEFCSRFAYANAAIGSIVNHYLMLHRKGMMCMCMSQRPWRQANQSTSFLFLWQMSLE